MALCSVRDPAEGGRAQGGGITRAPGFDLSVVFGFVEASAMSRATHAKLPGSSKKPSLSLFTLFRIVSATSGSSTISGEPGSAHDRANLCNDYCMTSSKT